MKMKKCMSLKNLFLLLAFVFSISLAFSAKVDAADDYSVPGQVVNVRQTDAGTSWVSIQWDTLLQSDYYYDTEISNDGVNWVEGGYTLLTSEDVYNLNKNSTYYVRVRACNRVDYFDKNTWIYGPYSEVKQVYTKPDINSISSAEQVAATENSVTLGWTPVEGATGYRVYAKDGSNGVLIAETNQTTHTISGLTIGSSYDFEVSAYALNGPYQDETYTISIYGVKTLPPVINNLSTSWWARQYMDIKWVPVNNVDGYEIAIYNEKGKKIKTLDIIYASASSEYFRYAKKNQIYTYQIRAYINVGANKQYGKWSSKYKMVYSPDVSIRRVSKTSQKITWNKVKGATSYTILRSTSKDVGYKKIATVKAKSSSFTNRKLKSKKRYYYRVVANQKVKKKTDSSVSPYYYFLY